MSWEHKKASLVSRIATLRSVLVAFSGGVDSTLLLRLCHDILKDRVLAVTATSILQPRHEKKAAMDMAQAMGVRHIVIPGRAMEKAAFVQNTPDRCYHCKQNLFEDLLAMAQEMGFAHVAHGANMDDLNDYRPGFRAADALGISAPLLDAKFSKNEVRRLSRELGLSNWDKPAMACLASRIPYGVSLTPERLDRVGAAEEMLMKEGFQGCRVRDHGVVARIEILVQDMPRLLDDALRKKLVTEMKRIGFSYVSLDLEGYSQGSMNRDIKA